MSKKNQDFDAMNKKNQDFDDDGDDDIYVGEALDIDSTDNDEGDAEEENEADQNHRDNPNDGTLRYFLGPVTNQRPGDYDDDNSTNNNTGSGNRVPGVERIGGPVRPFFGGVPTAYPVPTDPDPELYPIAPAVENQEGQQQQQQQRERNTRTGEERKCDTNLLVFSGILYLVILATVFLSVNFGTANQGHDEPKSSETFDNDTSTNSSLNYSSQPTLAPSEKRPDMTSNATSPSSSFKCFTDPWEIYLYEEFAFREGVNPFIQRVYHICPNTYFKVQTYDHQFGRFDESTGDYYGFMFFRPNVLVKCGFDGSYENNCTLSGGTHHVALIPVSLLQTEVFVFPGPENITIEGFRFTQAYRGANVFNQASFQSLTLKNCVFDHNYEMFTGIMSAPHYARKSSLNIHNCTFQHNTYKFFRTYNGRANVGVIASYPVNYTYAVVNTHIANTTFRNETFLLDDEPEIIPSPIKGYPPKGMYVNGAIINLVSAWGVLDITDSYFIGNKGYTDSLIIMDKDNRTVLRNSYGNSFVDNEPRESDDLSCILLYKNISYENGWAMTSLNEEEESCTDHDFF